VPSSHIHPFSFHLSIPLLSTQGGEQGFGHAVAFSIAIAVNRLMASLLLR
jgi:hypothetical protein